MPKKETWNDFRFFVISIRQHLEEINSHVVQIKDELYTIHQCPFIVSRLKVMSYVTPMEVVSFISVTRPANDYSYI